MDIKEKALNFAIKAFNNQVRKAEPEKDSVLHSIDVANKLDNYGFDDNVIAAGYLHDVVEDTEYTIDDIEKIFESDIASLVKGATEEDKSLRWEERKLSTIKRIKNLDIRHKAVITCDKISNTEDLIYLFGKNGKEDFSNFKRGREKKLWYWQESYKSLIYNENKNLRMFRDLKRNIDTIYLKKEISNKTQDIIKYKRQELYKLSNIINNKSKYRIEISGNCFEYIDNIKDILGEITSLEEVSFFNNNIDIMNELIEIDKDYLNNFIPSDLYIELLSSCIDYIKDNFDKIIYINKDNNNRSFTRIINILKGNGINIDAINITNKNIQTIIYDLCNEIINTIRNKELKDIKKYIRTKVNLKEDKIKKY